MPIAFSTANVTKTHNGFFIVHYTFNNVNYVVAVRNAAEFYVEAMRAASGVASGSVNDTDLLNFTNTTLANRLTQAINFDTST